METMYISFVLPAYNEEMNVLPLLKRLTNSMKNITKNYEILFVVEGNDNTLNILKKYKKEHPSMPLRYLYQKEQLGLMNAFKKGYNNVSPKTTHIVSLDVDLNQSPEEMPRLIKKSKEGYDIVIGSRYVPNSKVKDVHLWRRALSRVGNIFFRIAFNIKVGDKTCAYRMIDIRTIREIIPLVKSGGFEGLMEFILIANRKNKSIAEVPITMRLRKHGKSKLIVMKVFKGYFKLLMERSRIMSY